MIDSIKVNSIAAKLKKALAQIEKEENIKLEIGTISYNVAQFTVQLRGKTLQKDEKVEKVYQAICQRLGFTQNVIGMEFEKDGTLHQIVDIKTKNFKYPIIAQSSNGNRYKYSVASIKRLIGGDNIINRNKNLDKLLGE